MKIGCFALVEPFSTLERQFAAIAAMGLRYADVTDSHDGAALGREFGFAATASLDDHPADLREAAARHGLEFTAVCAHANLLDPTSPSTFGTTQIIKAIRLAHLLGVRQVITTEGDPKTDFGRKLTADQRLFAIAEKLYHPIRWARELHVELLLEPHGIVTDSVAATADLLGVLNADDVVGLNLDTGNLWLGGSDPHEYIARFGARIKHVHWKDLGHEYVVQRGRVFGCGMALIPLGDGIIGIRELLTQLRQVGFDGPTTLEVAGADTVRTSYQRLQEWLA